MPDFRIPKLSFHKASGQDVVRLGGKDFYVGLHGTQAAKVEYDRLVSEWLAAGRRPPKERFGEMTVTELIAAFWDHANAYYRHADGTTTTEISCFRDALKPLRRLYGHTAAKDFGPLALKAVRQAMIEAGLCRTNINRRIGRIKRVFKWGVENELVPSNVLHSLQAVSGLKAGRCGVRESEPVKPVPEENVLAILPFLSRQVAAMIQLQLLTGMRPGEVVCIRGIDIDTTGKLWLYRPGRHKTQYLGHERIIFFGPRAQQILKPFLKSDVSTFLFSPSDAEAERRENCHRMRKTPLSCGNVPGSNVKRRPIKKAKESYTVGSYARAIRYACERAFPLPEHLQPKMRIGVKRESRKAWRARWTPAQEAEIKAWRKDHSWHPHQLRHSAATNFRRTYGLEPAQVILGHKTLTVTQVYAEKNVEAAMQIMSEVG
jgi:integrase